MRGVLVGPGGVGQAAQHGEPADPCHPLGQGGDQPWAGAGGHGDDAHGTCGRVRGAAGPAARRTGPVRQHRHDGVQHVVGDRPVRRLRRQERPQPVAPADVRQPAQRPPGGRLLTHRNTALEVHADRGQPRRPHLARLDLGPRPVQLTRRRREGRGRDRRLQPRPGTVVAATAGNRLLVVQLPLQELHPAARGGHVVPHGLLFRRPLLGHPRIPLRVVHPRLPGGGPAALHAPHRAVHVEDLQHRLQPRAPEIHQRLQRRQRQRPARLLQHRQRAPHLLLGREAHRSEVRPDRLVLPARQQQHVRMVHATPGASHLLVVGDRGRGRPQVHHEPQVRLVEAHSQSRRGDQRLHPVRQQILLRLQPVGVLRLARVGSHRITALPQEGGDLLRRRHRQRVDDPRARQVPEPLPQPRQPVRRVRQLQHSQPQALPVQRPTQDQRVRAPRAQLLGHVRGDPGIGGRGRGQHRHTGRQLRQHRAQPAVVRPEVVAPVGDAVRLVDHEQARGGRQPGQHLITEIHRIEAFGAYEKNIGLTAFDLPVDRFPLLRVGRVDRPGPDPRPLRRLDLVPHQRQQRRDDHRRAGATPAQQSGGDEVHRRLAPSGALHHQSTPALLHQGRHRLPLVLPQPGRAPRSTDELGEDGIGFGAEFQVVHASMQPDDEGRRRIRSPLAAVSRSRSGRRPPWHLSRGGPGPGRCYRWS